MKFKDKELVEFSFDFYNPDSKSLENFSGCGAIVGIIPKGVIRISPADIYLVEVDEKTRSMLKNTADYDYGVMPLSEILITTRGSEIKETSKDIQTR